MVVLTREKMLRHLGVGVALIAAFATGVPGGRSSAQNVPPPADLVLLDARILTVDSAFRTATALAVRDGRFAAVGSNAEVRRHVGPNTRVIEGRGRTVVPGFIDTHVHALDVANGEATQPFVNLRSIKDVQDWLRAEAPRRGPGTLDLDAADVSDAAARAQVSDTAGAGRRCARSSCRGRLRVCLLAEHGGAPGGGNHARFPESRGRRHREGRRRRADGSAAERRGLLARFRRSSEGTPLDMLEQVHRQYLAAGITSVIERGATLPGFESYRKLKEAGRLRVRATVTIRVPNAGDSAGVERFIDGLPFKFGDGDEWLKAGPLKLVADGGILIGTSFMRKPFGPGARELYAIDDPGDRGFLSLTPAQIAAAIGIIHRRGWQMVAHVTGDAGVDVVLDGIEAAQKQTPGPQPQTTTGAIP